MSQLRDELVLWRNVSKMLDKLHKAKQLNTPAQTCPFCEKADVRVETMETMDGPDKSSKIAFYTCRSCNESWSDLIQ